MFFKKKSVFMDIIYLVMFVLIAKQSKEYKHGHVDIIQVNFFVRMCENNTQSCFVTMTFFGVIFFGVNYKHTGPSFMY